MERESKPNWWLVFALVPLMIVALVVEGQMPSSETEHRVLEVGIVLGTFGLIGLWVRANEGALIDEEFSKEPWVIKIVDPESQAEADPNTLPLADLPNESEDDEYRSEASPMKGRYN